MPNRLTTYFRSGNDPTTPLLNKVIKNALQSELELQGHILTGELVDSVQVITDTIGEDLVYSVIIADYARYIDEGLPPTSITWAMLPRLASYYEQRGINERNAVKYAAATIQIWMKTGMPTAFSALYSKTGKRTGFIKDAFEKAESDIFSVLDRATTYNVNLYFENHFKSEIV